MERVKGCILYYSGSGNTRLACRYVAKKCASADFRLHDMLRDGKPDLGGLGLVGFAAFADFLGPSRFFSDFVRGLPPGKGVPAFVLNTFGGFNGATLRVMARQVTAAGFRVVAGHALHMPENYPPLITAGRAAEQAPDPAELGGFQDFIRRLDEAVGRAATHGWPAYRPSLLERLIPALPRTTARKQMGEKYVDAALCTRCGLCAKVCPYGAIALPELPVFDQKKCYGCWACYNHCPAKAIHTKKYKGIGHYPAPIEAVEMKLPA